MGINSVIVKNAFSSDKIKRWSHELILPDEIPAQQLGPEPF